MSSCIRPRAGGGASMPRVLLLACAAFAIAGPAGAAGTWNATVTGTTDYIYRGASRTDERPAVQAGLGYQDPTGWFAGAWGSGVRPYPFYLHAVEVDLYAGMGWQLSPRWSARAAYTRYLYVWDDRPKPYDYGELSVSLGFEDRLAATISYQPDSTEASATTYARHRRAMAYELAGNLPLPSAWGLPGRPALVASAGYYDLDQLFGARYAAGAAGLRFTWPHLQLEVMHFVTDGTVARLYGDASADGRWAGSVTLRF